MPNFSEYSGYLDLHELELDRIKHFFERYKDLDECKWVKLDGYGDNAAIKEIEESIRIYNK